MRQSETINDLAKALAVAQGELSNVEKDGDNPHFRSHYATLAATMSTLRPVFSRHGLSILQVPDVREDGNVLLTTRLLHTSGQYIEGDYPVEPVKRDPQGYGSALTYARRYSAMAISGLAPEDDDGNDASDKMTTQQRDQAKQAAQRVAEEKLRTMPIQNERIHPTPLTDLLQKVGTNRERINELLTDMHLQLTEKFGVDGTAKAREALKKFGVSKSADLTIPQQRELIANIWYVLAGQPEVVHA